MEKRMGAVMTEKQVVRYTQLIARRMEIVMHSGASWKPEYAQELEEIDAELATLRQRVDAALEVKAADGQSAPEEVLENAESPDDELLLDDMEHQQLKEETRQAYFNGGRTPYLYDIDGNEYYTTRDGVRHYTRVEG